MLDNRGQPLLTPLSMTVPRPGVVALVGPHGAGKDVLGRILGRQATNYTGRVSIDGMPLAEMSVERASHLIGYAGDEPELIAGTIRDNILLPLKRHRPALQRDGLSEREHRRFVESIRSGNRPFRSRLTGPITRALASPTTPRWWRASARCSTCSASGRTSTSSASAAR